MKRYDRNSLTPYAKALLDIGAVFDDDKLASYVLDRVPPKFRDKLKSAFEFSDIRTVRDIRKNYSIIVLEPGVGVTAIMSVVDVIGVKTAKAFNGIPLPHDKIFNLVVPGPPLYRGPKAIFPMKPNKFQKIQTELFKAKNAKDHEEAVSFIEKADQMLSDMYGKNKKTVPRKKKWDWL